MNTLPGSALPKDTHVNRTQNTKIPFNRFGRLLMVDLTRQICRREDGPDDALPFLGAEDSMPGICITI